MAKTGKLLDQDLINKRVSETLMRLEIPEAKSFADFFSSAIGKAVPYTREAAGIVSSAAGAARSFLRR